MDNFSSRTESIEIATSLQLSEDEREYIGALFEEAQGSGNGAAGDLRCGLIRIDVAPNGGIYTVRRYILPHFDDVDDYEVALEEASIFVPIGHWRAKGDAPLERVPLTQRSIDEIENLGNGTIAEWTLRPDWESPWE